MAAPRDRGDALPDQRPARRALDPEQDAVGAGLPAKALGMLAGQERRAGRMALALPAEGLDPRDQLADLRFALRLAGGGRRPAPRPSAPFSSTKSLGPKALSACFTSGSRSSRWRSSARAAGPSRGSKASHASPVEPRLGDQRRRDRRAVLGEEGEQIGRDRASRQRARGLAPDRRIDRAARLAQQGEGAVADRSGPRRGRWASRSTSWRHCAVRRSGRSAGWASAVAILSSKRMPQALPARRAGAEAPYSPRRKVGRVSCGRVLSQSSQKRASSARSPPVTARNAASASAALPGHRQRRAEPDVDHVRHPRRPSAAPPGRARPPRHIGRSRKKRRRCGARPAPRRRPAPGCAAAPARRGPRRSGRWRRSASPARRAAEAWKTLRPSPSSTTALTSPGRPARLAASAYDNSRARWSARRPRASAGRCRARCRRSGRQGRDRRRAPVRQFSGVG